MLVESAYGSDGYPLLGPEDQEFMQALRNCGIGQIGYDELGRAARPATPDDPIDEIVKELTEIATNANKIPGAIGAGLALGQTLYKDQFGPEGYPDVFVAKVDPTTGKFAKEFHSFINCTILGEEGAPQATIPEIDDPTGFWAKHACLSTGDVSPIAATAPQLGYETWTPEWRRIVGLAQGMAGAVLDHESRHNDGLLKLLGQGVVLVNSVRFTRLDESRDISARDAAAPDGWSPRYSPSQIAQISAKDSPHRLVELQPSTYVLPRDRR